MASIYTVDYTDLSIDPQNKQPIVIPPGTWDKTTSLSLPGQSAALYGEHIAENFVHLLENFASETQPFNPTIGQLWYIPSIKTLKVLVAIATAGSVKTYTWRSVGGVSQNPTPPDDTNSLWYDTSNANPVLWQLKIYNTGTSSWMSVADRYVLKAGDAITGSITTSVPTVGFTSGKSSPAGFYPAAAQGTIIASAQSTAVLINTGGTGSSQFIVAQGTAVGAIDTPANQLLTISNAGKVTIYRGVLDVSSNKIVNVANGTATLDAVNYGQLSDLATTLRNEISESVGDLEDRKVNRSGDTMTGALTINTGVGTPISNIGTFSLVVRATTQGQSGLLITTTDTGLTTNAINIVNPYGTGGTLQSMFNVKAFTGNTGIFGDLRVDKSLAVARGITAGGISSMDVAASAIIQARHLTTKEYVDAKVAAWVPRERYARVNPASPLDGDILISGGNNYIYNAGWRQVFPAQWAS